MAGMNELPAADTPAPTASDDPIERNINIALEAQDGPSTSTETSNTETPSGEEGKPAGEAPKSTDSTSSGSDDKSQQQSKQKGTKEEKPTHSPKDLTLPDGTVVKGGPERRFYEQREIARQQATVAQSREREASQRAERAEASLRELQETTRNLHGVDPATLRIGATIVQDLQRDPVGTMKKLLAEVVAQGYKVEDIGAGVDTAAIQRMIEDRLPQQQNNDQPSEQEILAEAQREVDTFYSQHPDARPHDNVLARMMRDHPGLELQTAYFELKNGFAEKGFDFSLSLEDNLKAAQSSQDTQQQPTAPMVNGRAPTENVKPAGEVTVAHEDTDMSDIVRAAMRENGLKV